MNKPFLSKVRIFSGLSDSDLARILEIISDRSYRKDEVIFHADDPGSALFILKSGSVKISISDNQGREDILRVLYPTDFFGEMSILDGQHRSATVTAVEKSVALVIRREEFIGIIAAYPQVALNMLALLSSRIRKTDEKIASLRFADASGKAARVLLDMMAERGAGRENGAVVGLMLRRQDLADLAGLSRETLTRTLLEFQRSGMIRLDDKSITILDHAALRRELL